MRICLPDRPGSLGHVASALATVGADIEWIEIVSRGEGYATDDFMVSLPDSVMPDEAVSACHALEGTRVLWCSRFPKGTGLAMDIELLETILDDPPNALPRVVDAAPEVFHVHWAVLCDAGGNVTYASQMAPELTGDSAGRLAPFTEAHTVDLPEGWVPDWVETVAAVIPVGHGTAIVMGRSGGPQFERSEIARLRYIASLGASAG